MLDNMCTTEYLCSSKQSIEYKIYPVFKTNLFRIVSFLPNMYPEHPTKGKWADPDIWKKVKNNNDIF